MAESFLTALILLLATLIASTFGFGAGLVAMPPLTLLLGLATATPLFGLVGPTIASIILIRHWRLVDFASAWRLILSTLCGIPIGVWLITQIPSDLMTRCLGSLLVGYGIFRLGQWPLIRFDTTRWAALFGFIGGILGGAYNTNGPPIVIYGEMRRWAPRQFRATLLGYFLPTGVSISLGHAVTGLWTLKVFQLYGLSLPGILVAIAIGSRINQQLNTERFQSLLSGLLIILGILLWL
ncbi:MAG: sulfite exporter TauE/SafE family protein [Leptolyngbyaceae cyanobacterium]